MSTLEQIETAILNLSTDEFKQFKQWFLELDYQQWEQLEQDVAAGKLENLANEAIGREVTIYPDSKVEIEIGDEI